jgi:hypothetical protein
MTRAERLQELVDSATPYTMASGIRRGQFAKEISSELGIMEGQVNSFLRDMIGLNFRNIEDRKAFVDFFYVAFPDVWNGRGGE